MCKTILSVSSALIFPSLIVSISFLTTNSVFAQIFLPNSVAIPFTLAQVPPAPPVTTTPSHHTVHGSQHIHQKNQGHNHPMPTGSVLELEDALQTIDAISESPLLLPASKLVGNLEEKITRDFTDHLGSEYHPQAFLSVENARQVLHNLNQETDHHAAIVYIHTWEEELKVVIFIADHPPLHKTLNLSKEELLQTIQDFRGEITNPRRRNSQGYLTEAKQLYQWLIVPIESMLQQYEIDLLVLSVDAGLRSLPFAALYDGQEFLVEKYSLALIPSLNLVDARYQSLQNAQVLAMGASEFQQLNPLPAVPVELSLITTQIAQGKALLNQDFTRANLISSRQEYPYPIIHLATHSEFVADILSQSYIQFWNEKLPLDQLRHLKWNEPPVELLVLSSCRTALGSPQAELGFAGLAVAAGVKSALASLWYVSDEGTLALMTEFYRQIPQVTTKAEALQKAQLAMIHGNVRIEQGQLRGVTTENVTVGEMASVNLQHPYYWSSFTLVGSPW